MVDGRVISVDGPPNAHVKRYVSDKRNTHLLRGLGNGREGFFGKSGMQFEEVVPGRFLFPYHLITPLRRFHGLPVERRTRGVEMRPQNVTAVDFAA